MREKPTEVENNVVLTIGQVARRAGVGVETIRFYEREGLVPKPPQTRAGYRQYPPDAVQRVAFIRRAKELGFTLAEVQQLLSLRVAPKRSCADVRDLAREKVATIENKIQDLLRMQEALKRLVRSCRGKGPTGECPLLEALEADAGWQATEGA